MVPACVIMISLFYTFFPCLHINFGFNLIPECDAHPNLCTKYWTNLLIKIGLALFSCIAFTSLSTTTMLEHMFYSSMHCLCLLNYLRLLWRRVKQDSWQPDRVLHVFREIQLICNGFNDIHQAGLMWYSIGILSFSVILGSYLAIETAGQLPLPYTLSLLLIGGNCGVMLVDLYGRIHSKLLPTFKKVKEEARRSTNRMPSECRKHFRKCISSWPYLKVKIGYSNYFEEETTLTIMLFSVEQLVSLVLIH